MSCDGTNTAAGITLLELIAVTHEEALCRNQALELCRVLSDPTRFALMAAIWKVERCVCELQIEVLGSKITSVHRLISKPANVYQPEGFDQAS